MKKSLVSILSVLLMSGISGSAWAGSVVAADLNCTNPAGCVQTNEISDGAVTNNKIATGAVATSNIAGGAVTTGTIADGAVSTTKISDGAVTTNKVVDGAVTNGKIAAGAVTDVNISGTISGSKLGSHTHNGSDIADGTITNSKIGDGAVTDSKISGTISGAKLGTHVHSGSDIMDATITTSKIADGAITGNKLTDWSVNGSKIADFSITDTKISSNAIDTSKIADGAVTDAKIAGPITASKLAGSIGVENLGVYTGIKIVHKGAADNVNTFNALSAAMQAVGSNSADRYAIIVMPGIYAEDFSFLNPWDVVRYNIDIIGQSRTGTIIRPLNSYGWSPTMFPLADGLVVKNVTFEGGVDISGSNDVSIIDSTIRTGAAAYGILSHSPTNVIIENITIEAASNGRGMFLYGYSKGSNIKLNNITIKLANGSSGIWVFPTGGYDDPVKITNLTITGVSSTGFGMSFFSYSSGAVELDNVSIEDTVNTFSYDPQQMGDIKVKATNCKFNNTGELVMGGGSNRLEINIDNSTIKNSITSTASPIKIGGSKITGSITSSNGQVKIINSYDGNYDPIQNGSY